MLRLASHSRENQVSDLEYTVSVGTARCLRAQNQFAVSVVRKAFAVLLICFRGQE